MLDLFVGCSLFVVHCSLFVSVLSHSFSVFWLIKMHST